MHSCYPIFYNLLVLPWCWVTFEWWECGVVLFGATGGGLFGAGDLRSRLFWLLPGLGRTMFPPPPPAPLPGVPRLLLLLVLAPAAESVGGKL